MTKFNDKLSTRLKQLGMTQRELANKVGTTEASISRYVKGERIPNDALITKIADALEVNVSFFKDGHNEKVEDLMRINELIARNEKKMTPEEKLAIIRLLSKDQYGDPDGKFSQYREYNENHELVLEIAYHPEHHLTHDKENKPVLHAHDYDPKTHGKDWHQPARNLTMEEFEKYKRFFVNISDAELKRQKERL